MLEGTELYTELQSAIVAYAKTKGDYQGRYDELVKLYENVEGADINAELTAELVGDYLFTDSDFIGSLSTEHRNVFQKIFDEIKYLCKTATAGSKEARQLEKVKKAFEDAYRSETKNTTADGGVKYALGDGTVKNASELSRSDLQYLLESAQNGEMTDTSYIPLRRNTPEFFIGVVEEHSKGTVVVENYPMAVTVEHIRQNMDEADGQSYGEARPHGFSVDDIITISEKMGDPSYIVLQKNGRYAEVVSFYNKRNKQVVVAIDFADSNPAGPKNFKHSQYMNGYESGYYNIIVTQYEPDNFAKYLNDNEVVYRKKEMNGRYQVGSGRIVTVTHDTPFIEDIISQLSTGVKEEKAPNAETRDVFGFAVNKNANVNEDLLEELSIHDPNAEVDADGNVTVYHRTTAENADSIRRTGIMKAQEDALFFSSKDSGYASDYGDTVVKLKIPSTVLQVNDIFDGEVHFDIPLKYKNGGFQLDVSQYLQDTKEPSLSYSLSGNEQGATPAGGYRITGEDIALAPTKEDIAPVREADPVAEASNEDLAPVAADLNGSLMDEDIAPVAETAPAKEAVENEAPAADKPIQTVKERLEAKLQNLNDELEHNRALQKDAEASFHRRLEKLQAEYRAQEQKIGNKLA